MWFNWEEVNKLIQKKRVVFFGRGDWVDKTVNYLASTGDYIVDNNEYEHGQGESGLVTYSPEKLRTENFDQIYIIITTTGFLEVQEQLCGYGFIPGEHFCVTPALKNFHTISRINEHEQIIYLTCSDHYLEKNWQRGGGLYRFDIQSREMKKLINGLCHGIIETKDSIYLVDDKVGIRVLEKDLNQRTTFQLPLKSRPHGIAYCPQRELIFINFSERDSVGIYDTYNYTQVDEIFISDKREKIGISQHHVNDLCVFNDSLYVSMFSFSGNWKIGMFDGGILEFDIDSRKLLGPVVSNLWMPHSPKIINGILSYCDSMPGRVYAGTHRLIIEFNGFVRGIAHDGEFYYIGQSMHRYIDRRLGTTNNISLDAGIFIVDDVNKMTKFFAMPHLTNIDTVMCLEN